MCTRFLEAYFGSEMEGCMYIKGCPYVIVELILFFLFNTLSCMLGYSVIVSSRDGVRDSHKFAIGDEYSH